MGQKGAVNCVCARPWDVLAPLLSWSAQLFSSPPIPPVSSPASALPWTAGSWPRESINEGRHEARQVFPRGGRPLRPSSQGATASLRESCQKRFYRDSSVEQIQ